jgi:hypothetical protein
MIFISYSWADSKLVRLIHEDLRAAGQAVWIDYQNLDLTQALEPQIQGALNSASCVLLIESRSANRSHWVQREIAWATAARLPLFICSASNT